MRLHGTATNSIDSKSEGVKIAAAAKQSGTPYTRNPRYFSLFPFSLESSRITMWAAKVSMTITIT
jgi:hypothetical protein